MGAACSTCSDGSTVDSGKKSRTTESQHMMAAYDDSSVSGNGQGFPGEYEGASRPASVSSSSRSAEVAWVFEEHPTFWEGVASFLQQLPRKSKEKIWSHATSVKREDGKREHTDCATRKRQFEMLLTDTVLVYLKILYKNQTCPITKRHVSLMVKPLAPWLMDRCHRSLEQSKFYDRDFLPTLIVQYQRELAM